MEQKINEIALRQRRMMAGLYGILSFERSFIEEVTCTDEIDSQIIELIIQAGMRGTSSPAITQALSQYRLNRHQITRRIHRMNKKLEKEVKRKIAEKRGRKWAATLFIRRVWNLPEEEVKEELSEET